MEQLNPMQKHVLSIPDMMEEVYWRIESDARQIIPTPDIFSTRDVCLFGSGDSYNAALGASLAFSRLARVDAHPLTAMQASRYTADFLQEPAKNTLAVGISSSGEAARSVEAMSAFAKNGARTLAVSGNPESRMALKAQAVLNIKISGFVQAPGVRGYAVSQIALYLLAIRFAEVKGNITMDEAGALRKRIYNYRESLTGVLLEHSQVLESFAARCDEAKRVEFLASGPCRAAADFGAAKAIEAVGVNASSQDIEEFAHINFFSNNPETIPTILIAPDKGRSMKRTSELVQVLAHQGRPTLLITNGEAFKDVSAAVRLPGYIDEEFFALFASVLAAAVVSYMKNGSENEYFRGHRGAYSEEGLPDIRSSELVVD